MKKLSLLLAISIFLFSCKKDSLSSGKVSGSSTNDNLSGKPVLEIGDIHAGGIIFYFDNADHKHGRVVARTDVGQYPWDLTVFDPQHPQDYNPHFVGGTETKKYSGAANTSGIVLSLGSGAYAAYMCRSYTGKGYNDWSLPSRDELNLIYERIKLKGLSSFSGTYYWSSSEIDNKSA